MLSRICDSLSSESSSLGLSLPDSRSLLRISDSLGRLRLRLPSAQLRSLSSRQARVASDSWLVGLCRVWSGARVGELLWCGSVFSACCRERITSSGEFCRSCSSLLLISSISPTSSNPSQLSQMSSSSTQSQRYPWSSLCPNLPSMLCLCCRTGLYSRLRYSRFSMVSRQSTCSRSATALPSRSSDRSVWWQLRCDTSEMRLQARNRSSTRAKPLTPPRSVRAEPTIVSERTFQPVPRLLNDSMLQQQSCSSRRLERSTADRLRLMLWNFTSEKPEECCGCASGLYSVFSRSWECRLGRSASSLQKTARCLLGCRLVVPTVFEKGFGRGLSPRLICLWRTGLRRPVDWVVWKLVFVLQNSGLLLWLVAGEGSLWSRSARAFSESGLILLERSCRREGFTTDMEGSAVVNIFISLISETMDNYEKQMEAQSKEQEKKEQAEQMKKTMMAQLLTPEAKDRLNKIKLVKPEKVAMIENALIQAAQTGRITSKVTEAQLIEMLERESDRKVDTKITIVRLSQFTRRGLDDDW